MAMRGCVVASGRAKPVGKTNDAKAIGMTLDPSLKTARATIDLAEERTHGSSAISQRERVARDIVQSLYEGRFTPGQRLIESHLTVAYDTSRSTVREALNQLASSGIVELTQQRGAQIRMMSIQEAIDSLVVVGQLYALAAQLASNKIDQPGAKQFVQDAFARVTAFKPSSGEVEHTFARDRFYAALAALAGNSELSRVLPTVDTLIFRVQFRSILLSADRGRHTHYRRIAEAIIEGRPAAAEAAVRAHVGKAMKALIEFRDGASA